MATRKRGIDTFRQHGNSLFRVGKLFRLVWLSSLTAQTLFGLEKQQHDSPSERVENAEPAVASEKAAMNPSTASEEPLIESPSEESITVAAPPAEVNPIPAVDRPVDAIEQGSNQSITPYFQKDLPGEQSFGPSKGMKVEAERIGRIEGFQPALRPFRMSASLRPQAALLGEVGGVFSEYPNDTRSAYWKRLCVRSGVWMPYFRTRFGYAHGQLLGGYYGPNGPVDNLQGALGYRFISGRSGIGVGSIVDTSRMRWPLLKLSGFLEYLHSDYGRLTLCLGGVPPLFADHFSYRSSASNGSNATVFSAAPEVNLSFRGMVSPYLGLLVSGSWSWAERVFLISNPEVDLDQFWNKPISVNIAGLMDILPWIRISPYGSLVVYDRRESPPRTEGGKDTRPLKFRYGLNVSFRWARETGSLAGTSALGSKRPNFSRDFSFVDAPSDIKITYYLSRSGSLPPVTQPEPPTSNLPVVYETQMPAVEQKVSVVFNGTKRLGEHSYLQSDVVRVLLSTGRMGKDSNSESTSSYELTTEDRENGLSLWVAAPLEQTVPIGQYLMLEKASGEKLYLEPIFFGNDPIKEEVENFYITEEPDDIVYPGSQNVDVASFTLLYTGCNKPPDAVAFSEIQKEDIFPYERDYRVLYADGLNIFKFPDPDSKKSDPAKVLVADLNAVKEIGFRLGPSEKSRKFSRKFYPSNLEFEKALYPVDADPANPIEDLDTLQEERAWTSFYKINFQVKGYPSDKVSWKELPPKSCFLITGSDPSFTRLNPFSTNLLCTGPESKLFLTIPKTYSFVEIVAPGSLMWKLLEESGVDTENLLQDKDLFIGAASGYERTVYMDPEKAEKVAWLVGKISKDAFGMEDLIPHCPPNAASLQMIYDAYGPASAYCKADPSAFLPPAVHFQGDVASLDDPAAFPCFYNLGPATDHSIAKQDANYLVVSLNDPDQKGGSVPPLGSGQPSDLKGAVLTAAWIKSRTK